MPRGASACCPKPALRPLERNFYARSTLEVARDLLGCLLVRISGRGVLTGRIVEVEAYVGPKDRACHASRGRTARTEIMFGEPGYAYVYLIYGMYHCLNIVTERSGFPAAVLIRAVEPLEDDLGATNGPGRLCRAMKIDRTLNGADLTSPPLFVANGLAPRRIGRSPRIGVEYAGPWARRPWRLFDRDSDFVSRPR